LCHNPFALLELILSKAMESFKNLPKHLKDFLLMKHLSFSNFH